MTPPLFLINKPLVWLSAAMLSGLFLMTAHAQDRIFRCGNEYTNHPVQSQRKDCVALDGGRITVIPAPRIQAARPAAAQTNAGNAPASADQSRVNPALQKARDSDARTILENELKRAEASLDELQREYNAGQPVRRPQDIANPALYAERVAALKASMGRAEADVASIRRELQRVGGGTVASTSPASTANASAGSR